jgi:hypothetical protein
MAPIKSKNAVIKRIAISQTLHGHENLKTTERYAQVTARGFERLESPWIIY